MRHIPLNDVNIKRADSCSNPTYKNNALKGNNSSLIAWAFDISYTLLMLSTIDDWDT